MVIIRRMNLIIGWVTKKNAETDIVVQSIMMATIFALTGIPFPAL